MAPDSWKGSLTAPDAARRIAAGLREGLARLGHPDSVVTELPMADGGEGTMEVVAARLGGRVVRGTVRDAFGRPRHGRVLILADGRGVVEAAEGPGFIPAEDRPAPADRASSAGLADLMRLALSSGASELVMALGGSGSSGGGSGLLAALGAHGAWDAGLQGLDRGARLSLPALPCPVTVWCDVSAPLTGPDGAIRQFGPQKGLPPDSLPEWDRVMEDWGRALEEAARRPVAGTAGAGAAGGLGAALAALGARLTPGGPQVATVLGLSRAVAGADWVVTGEGRIDRQSLQGKVVGTVLDEARRHARPVVVVAPQLADGSEAIGDVGAALFPVLPGPLGPEDAIREAGRLAEAAGRRLAAWLIMAAPQLRGRDATHEH